MFDIAGVHYAIATAQVREVVRAVTIVPLPGVPPIVQGVINVRGRLVPVLDVRARFRLTRRPVAHTDHLILAEAGARLVAVPADRALALAHLDPSAVDDARAAVSGAEYISGVAKLPDGLVLIHDLNTFLRDAEADALDAAVAGLTPAQGAPRPAEAARDRRRRGA